MLPKNTKTMVRQPDSETNLFDFIGGVLLGDTLAPYLLIIFMNDIQKTSIVLIKENGFTLKRPEADYIAHKL